MSQNRTQISFLAFCKKFIIPISLVFSITSSLGRILEYSSRQNIIILAAIGFIVSISWMIYVLTKKTPDPTQNYVPIHVYNYKIRKWSAIISFICFIILVFVSIPRRPFSLPNPSFIISNQDYSDDLLVVATVEFHLTTSLMPLTDSIVDKGMLRMKVQNTEVKESMVVPAGTNIESSAEFISPEKYKDFWKKGNTNIQFSITSSRGSLMSNKMPFSNEHGFIEIIELRRNN